MLIPKLILYLLGLVLATLIGITVYVVIHNRHVDERPPALVVVDSIMVADRAGQRARDSLVAEANESQRRVDSMRVASTARIAALNANASAAEQRAKTMADVARANGDTASAAWGAYEAEHERTDALMRRIAIADSTRAAAEELARKWKAAYDSADAHARTLELVNAQLRAVIQTLSEEQRCRVLGFDCPSRTTTFIVGATLGLAGTLIVNHNLPHS